MPPTAKLPVIVTSAGRLNVTVLSVTAVTILFAVPAKVNVSVPTVTVSVVVPSEIVKSELIAQVVAAVMRPC